MLCILLIKNLTNILTYLSKVAELISIISVPFFRIRTIFPDPYDFSEFVRVFQIRMIFPDPYDFSGYVGFFPILYDPDPYELSGSVLSADPYDCFRIGQNS